MKPSHVSLLEIYQALCLKKGWQEDANQKHLLTQLEEVITKIEQPRPWWHLWRSTKEGLGIYVYGPVGRGKTMVLDLAFNAIASPKKRWHFTSFMQMVHKNLKRYSQASPSQPIALVAKMLAKKYRLIMIDEFQVTEIADAMVLLRLFTQLQRQGLTVFMTSNLAPDELYKDGLHYDRFAPFVDLVKHYYLVHFLTNEADQDYRRRHEEGCVNSSLENHFAALARQEGIKETTLIVNERVITFSKSTTSAVWLTFKECCEIPWGPGEYQAIAQHFKTVYLVDVPRLTSKDRDSARRFMTLIDCLYDEGVDLYLEAATTPEHLYKETHKNKLPFERTVSRLIEMQKHHLSY